MSSGYQNPDVIKKILSGSTTIAIVGISNKPDRPSYEVADYLKVNGYRIIPVNPNLDTVLGEKAYPDLASIPEPVDIVDIFRRAEDVGPVVDDAIKAGTKAVWIQLGIVNGEAAEKASQAGLDVVMDRCIKVEHHKLYG